MGSAELALELAAIGGAQAIGMDDTIGSLEIGKRADLIVVDLDRPHLLPRSTWTSNLVYSPNPDAVYTVVVDGEVVVESRRLCGQDMDKIVREANDAADLMDSKTGLAQRYRGRTRWNWHR